MDIRRVISMVTLLVAPFRAVISLLLSTQNDPPSSPIP